MLPMKKIYIILFVGLFFCMCGNLHAQNSETARIAQIRARLDTLVVRDTAYLSEVDLSVGNATF